MMRARHRLAYAYLVFALSAFLATMGWSTRAAAYPWMNRHGYNNCATCHVDPSGGSLLTPYGRAQSELLLSSRYGSKASADPADEEAGRFSQALFGVVTLPDSLNLGGWIRNGYIWNFVDGELVDHRYLLMRADAAAHVRLGRFRAYGDIGIASSGSASQSEWAWLTTNPDGPNLVGREYWLGWDASDAVLIRAGRLNLPFGLRNPEHTAWVRAETRTDYNQDQQHGVAVAYNEAPFRAEAMVIAGNYQLRPDDYRERGISGYLEWSFATGQTVGASTLVTHADSDLGSRLQTWRQSHGAFSRLSWGKLAVLTEADALVSSVKSRGTELGLAAFLQADYEIFRGVHGVATGETLRRAEANADWGWAAWAGAAWFVYPHFDLRGDVIFRGGLGGSSTTTYLIQLHGYL